MAVMGSLGDSANPCRSSDLRAHRDTPVKLHLSFTPHIEAPVVACLVPVPCAARVRRAGTGRWRHPQPPCARSRSRRDTRANRPGPDGSGRWPRPAITADLALAGGVAGPGCRAYPGNAGRSGAVALSTAFRRSRGSCPSAADSASHRPCRARFLALARAFRPGEEDIVRLPSASEIRLLAEYLY